MARPKKVERDFEITVKVLKAAESLFAKQGFANTSLRHIADKAGIKAPSLLYHFESKEKLYEQVLIRFYDEIEITLFPQKLDPNEDLLSFVFKGLNSMTKQKKQLAILFMRELIGTGSLGEAVILSRLMPLLERIEVLYREVNPEVSESTPVKELILQYLLSVVVKASLPKSGDKFLGDDKVFEDILAHHIQTLNNW